jgi:predicted ArsR family transcriptional regulator
MAECQAVEGGYLLIENHCPICAAATACQGFCHAERDVFQRALGGDVSVERTEHIVSGDRRCAYRIAPKGAPHAGPAKRKRRKKS